MLTAAVGNGGGGHGGGGGDAAHEPAGPAEVVALVDALCARVAACESAVIAFSGGVDSTLVLAVAVRTLGSRALALTGLSASVAAAEAEDARRIAAELGAAWQSLPSGELDDPAYVANGIDRCFHCKSGLYALCRRVADEHGFQCLLNGTNRDDPGDWRPGLRAAEQAGVRSPLLECGLGKADVRAVARHLGLPNWDKPAQPCLASRLPYGTAVTVQRLASVERVERTLREIGFRDVRARHHGDEVRLEVEPERVGDLTALTANPTSAAGSDLAAAVREAGFRRLTVEPAGFRSGRLNDAPTGAR